MTLPPSAIALRFVDDDLLVVDKPAGLLAVPGRGDDKLDCMSERVRACWPDALVVHRLDMATSGLMLFARGAAMQRVLGRAFESRQIGKRYVACVDGRLAAPQGLIDLPIMADWPRRPLQKIDPPHGKPSCTRWQALDFDERWQASRVELEPVSGRTHQLRVHLAAIGHPMLGDALYAPQPVYARAPRLLLHASELRLRHPRHGGTLRLVSPVPF